MKKTCVVSITPSFAASIAVQYSWRLEQAYRQIAGFLRQTLGVNFVFSCDLAQKLALEEAASELVSRLHPFLSVPDGANVELPDGLPLITGNCPGLVCYLEKVHPQLLPNLLTAPSLQTTQGFLVKSLWAVRHSLAPSCIYHVVLSPCYDRKIEALRFSTVSKAASSPPVDCVLTTVEFHELVHSRGGWVADVPLDPIDDSRPSYGSMISPTRITGTPFTSGGYAQALLHATALHYAGIPNAEAQWEERPATHLTRRETPDCREFSINLPGFGALNFATVYGFKNVQNLIRKIKAKKCPYLFIEAEACPGGCLGGGGQLKQDRSKLPPVDAMKATLLEGTELQWPILDSDDRRLFLQAIHADPMEARALLHNTYRERGTDNTPLSTGVGISPAALRW